MNIGCICVTENRAPVFGIALASFLEQIFDVSAGSGNRADLWIVLPGDIRFPGNDKDVREYLEVHNRLCAQFARVGLLPGDNGISVAERLHRASKQCFEEYGCDLVTIWDDDDYSPPDRLERTVRAFYIPWRDTPELTHPRCTSYGGGYFVNLRTLEGKLVPTLTTTGGHLWGGCLAFNRAAFEAVGGFAGRACPGYDRSFLEDVQAFGLPPGMFPTYGMGWMPPYQQPPIAFCHGKNIATFTVGELTPLEGYLKTTMPASVFAEVKRAQQFLIDKRIFPPGS